MRWITVRSDRDRGSALVAAFAVALIGIGLATLLVTQAIIVARDSGRDSVRTIEIHAAEAGIDAAMLELESSSPCSNSGPLEVAWNPLVIGKGTDAVTVEVSITYKDQYDAFLTSCLVDPDSGANEVDGIPVSAVIRSVATSNVDQFGIQPVRILEAEVNLIPRIVSNYGAAIFSATNLTSGGGFTLTPVAGGDSGDIWIDSGDFNCNTNVTVEGNVWVVEGGADMQDKDCSINGNLRTRDTVKITQHPVGAPLVTGNVTTELATADLDVQAADTEIGGYVRLGGVVAGAQKGSLVVGSSVTENDGSVPHLESVGLPQIYYKTADKAQWVSEGFTNKTRAQFITDVVAATSGIKGSWSGTDGCTIGKTESGNKAIVLDKKAVYDLSDCPGGFVGKNGAGIELKSDAVLIVSSFTANVTGLKLTSGDGAKHTLYIIVPVSTDSGSYVSGDITLGNSTQMSAPAEIFIYSPNRVEIYNNTTTRGQVYGGEVVLNAQGKDFEYSPTTLDFLQVLLQLELESQGSSVELTAKHEVAN